MKQAQSNILELWRSFSDSWKKIYTVAETNIQTVGLSLPEFRALKHLDESGPCPMVSFAEQLSITPPAVTGMVDRLEERGLVERTRNIGDRRVVTISITESGQKLLRKALRVHERFVEHQMRHLTEVEMKQFLVYFSRLADAAEAYANSWQRLEIAQKRH
jgi:MarR family transcriptional regulator, 2-MHQ and catechol-resistance regulon repressor